MRHPQTRAAWYRAAMALALITGANRGIGLEFVRALRKKNDRVFAVCRASSPELTETGAEVISGIDVTREDAVIRMAQATRGEKLDLVICNAGVLVPDSLESCTAESLRMHFEVNAVGPLLVTKALAPQMPSGAKVALITSRMGSIADNSSGRFYGYRMSKAALNMAGASLAIDLRGRGIAVITLHPGYVQTGMTGGAGDVTATESAERMLARIHELTLNTSGKFLHASGQELPW